MGRRGLGVAWEWGLSVEGDLGWRKFGGCPLALGEREGQAGHFLG